MTQPPAFRPSLLMPCRTLLAWPYALVLNSVQHCSPSGVCLVEGKGRCGEGTSERCGVGSLGTLTAVYTARNITLPSFPAVTNLPPCVHGTGTHLSCSLAVLFAAQLSTGLPLMKAPAAVHTRHTAALYGINHQASPLLRAPMQRQASRSTDMD